MYRQLFVAHSARFVNFKVLPHVLLLLLLLPHT
jgi:hypothetical protein